MKPLFCRRATAALLGAVLVLAATAALADWSHDPLANDPVTFGTANKASSQTITDGQAGSLTAWLEISGGTYSTVRVQRVDADGNLLWGTAGVAAHQSFGYLYSFALIADGTGGAYLAIMDSHDAVYYHVYVQHITNTGAAAWGSQGLNATPLVTTGGQVEPTLCADGSGGAIVAFIDTRNSPSDLFGQRFDAAGNLLWTDTGKALCTAASSEGVPDIAADGSGGFYLTWEDSRDFGATGYDIYTNRYDAAGNPLWTANGYPTCTATNAQYRPRVVADAQGGAIVVWYDYRNSAATGSDIFGQRYLPSGTGVWYYSGRAICDQAGDQLVPVPASDGVGGVYVAWQDNRADSFTGTTIYIQGVAADGQSRWPSGGVAAGGGAGGQQQQALALTSDGNIAVAWADSRNGNSDVYAQLFSYAGGKLGSYYGQPIGAAPFEQGQPGIAPDGRGGVVVGFVDFRDIEYGNIFMQRLDRTGVLGDPAAVITRLIDHPQDQGGRMLLDWSQSWLDEYQGPGIYRYSLWRRFPGSAAVAAKAPAPTESGLSAADLLALQQAGWNYIDQVTPQQFAEYGFVVPTFADSTAAGAPLTEYMVMTETGYGYIESNIVGGWSVDNLAPGAPLALAVALNGPDADLTWTSSGYHDEDLQHYNLYRAATPGVVPGLPNLVTTSADTTAVDPAVPGGTWYYVVTAVDVHGNEGEPSNEVMIMSASAVDDGGIPRVTVIRGAYPNPFNPTTNIRYGVPATGQVQLTVFDLRGQKVAALVDGVMTAGYHDAVWNGQGADGRPAPSGVYFARLEAAGVQATSKLLLAK